MAAFMIAKTSADSAAMASTMAFATLCLARLFEGFDARSGFSLAKIGFTTNKFSLGAFLIGGILLACVLFISPVHSVMDISSAFTAVNGVQILGLAFIPMALTQVIRIIREAAKK